MSEQPKHPLENMAYTVSIGPAPNGGFAVYITMVHPTRPWTVEQARLFADFFAPYWRQFVGGQYQHITGLETTH